jgi:hypothetical protein
MIEKGQWMVLPYNVVRHLPNFRASPIGVVPQRERRPRTIVDYTFFGINLDTLPLTAPEAMQFGRALERVIQSIVRADPRHGPVHLIKVDIADGFYRIHLAPEDIPTLGVTLPFQDEHGQPLIAFPLTLPMGWVNSPPLFCAATETVCDMANQHLTQRAHPPAHRLDDLADTPPSADPVPASVPVSATCAVPEPDTTYTGPPRKPLSAFDVYVDDFIGLGQGSKQRLRSVRRTLFHCLDEVMRPVSPSDPESRQEPASVKKLKKGDAHWATRKVVLGWLLDTVRMTIELPPHRLDRLNEILDSLPRTKHRIALKKWHQIVGELRSMSLAVPGLRGCFSLLQEAFRHQDKHRIRLTTELHDFLDDMRYFVQDLAARPTRLYELVPESNPSVVGACDAAKSGMGGVFFAPTITGPPQPYLWREPFPASIQSQVVSFSNPHGKVTNSDLELAGTTAHLDVVSHTVDVRERTLYTLTDNTPALAWQQKGSTTTTKAPAYLLRLQALHQRFHRYHPRFSHIPGKSNVMADDCSRLWHLSDVDLLAHFNREYPQDRSWQLCPLRANMTSSLISALHTTRSDPASVLSMPVQVTAIGNSGPSFAPKSMLTHSLRKSMTQSDSSNSLPFVPEMDACPKAVDLSGLLPWTKPFVPLARRSPTWGPVTLA